MRKFVILLFLMTFIGAISAAAQWHKVGSQEIDNTVDNHTLHVTEWRDGFRKMRLGVTGAPVDFFRVIITYGSGITEENWINALIKSGEFSHVKDLHLHERSVRKIEIWYEPESLEGQKAHVTMYARE